MRSTGQNTSYNNNGRSNGKHKEGSNLGDDVRDDLVLCAMTREEVEEDLQKWRVVFERHGLKISRTKTEYLPSPTNETP